MPPPFHGSLPADLGDSTADPVPEPILEALRRYVRALPREAKGWLAGVRDPRVGRVLAALHAEPHRDWTVDALARIAALSRSALAARFTALVGAPPIQYLHRWRLALAAEALRRGTESIGRIAGRSGYESEAAFSRAFRREFGAPPAAWRRRALDAQPHSCEPSALSSPAEPRCSS